MRTAKVFRNNEFAGILTEINSNEYVFRYDNVYFDNANQPAISLTLPKTKKEYQNKSLFPFFFSLLSEGKNKALQCQLYKIDENDHFGLLLAIGGEESAGAVSVKEITND